MSLRPIFKTMDGLNGLSFGVLGGSEWAVSGADLYRRPDAHVGTYGGWRWECSVEHARRFPALFPVEITTTP